MGTKIISIVCLENQGYHSPATQAVATTMLLKQAAVAKPASTTAICVSDPKINERLQLIRTSTTTSRLKNAETENDRVDSSDVKEEKI